MDRYKRSESFFSKFISIFENPETRDQAISHYVHNTDFTEFIIAEIKKVIEYTGYCPQTEYLRIDAIGYTRRWHELPETNGFNRHLWDLQIAVEHENDDKDWLDEVIKLAHISCPLRVVIGYIPKESRPVEDTARLEYAANALKKLQCSENLKTGEFMIILGNSKTSDPTEYFNYKPYVLDADKMSFIPLT